MCDGSSLDNSTLSVCHIGTLKWTTAGGFTPQKLASAANHDLFPLGEIIIKPLLAHCWIHQASRTVSEKRPILRHIILIF